MLEISLPSFLGGSRVEPHATADRIRSIDGTFDAPVAVTSASDLRKALRHGDACQARLYNVPLEKRIADARLVLEEYDRRVKPVADALAHFRGLTARDAAWMCKVNVVWGRGFEVLAQVMFGGAVQREVTSEGRRYGELHWRSKGKACLFSSSTMDGPAGVVALCHAMLAGTHLILRPSYRDAATHIAFDILYEHGLSDYAQLVRWRADAPEAPALNRLVLTNVAQSVIFSSNETFRELLDGAAPARSPEWDALYFRSTRYGTGLPLAIVTPRCDLDAAARDLVEGARLGGGRFCLSTGPVLVDRACHDALIERVIDESRQLRRGSPLEMDTDLSSHEAETADALRAAILAFGGTRAFGEVRTNDMDVMVIADAPTSSPSLYREVPGPVLSFIPVDSLEQATAVANSALRQNARQAWTAIAVFGDEDDHARVTREVDSFRYLRGGVVAQVKLLLPHQGSYFALDLMRRVSME